MTPKPFTEILGTLRYGHLNDDLAKELQALTLQCEKTGRAGTLSLKLTLKPGKGGQIEVFDDISVTAPKDEKGSSLLFATTDGQLTRDNPRQLSIEGLRSVDMSTGELRRVGE
jgi:hypothetical protein